MMRPNTTLRFNSIVKAYLATDASLDVSPVTRPDDPQFFPTKDGKGQPASNWKEVYLHFPVIFIRKINSEDFEGTVVTGDFKGREVRIPLNQTIEDSYKLWDILGKHFGADNGRN